MRVRDYCLYAVFRAAILLIGYLPFWLIYRLSDVTVFVLFHLLRVRRQTVWENLQRAFPELSSKKLKKLSKAVYRNFSDVIIFETLKSFTLSVKSQVKRFKLQNPELVEQYAATQQPLIAVIGHYANWEWGTCKHHQAAYECIDFYKPLKNKLIDRYVRRNRARHGSQLVSVMQAAGTFLGTRGKVCCYTLLADKQNVKQRRFKRVTWLPFLGDTSPFLNGPEHYARQFNYPLVYGHIERVRRGYYAFKIIPVSDHPSELPEGELTKRWVSLLELQVKADPASWFWFFAATRARQDHHLDKTVFNVS